ncbi:hypothetical protein [Kaistia algarum]|uniref:hypothetical protein n=1 Tax=Kaistia algarum TaxID=2083279 RepID=UPI0010572069|nr:hypothetical protein [Kaistia algarum]MCX5512286.1 hypothetical protein [Kaistia algarum]
MPSLPSPTDDYKAPSDMALSRAAWDAALVSIGTRLRGLEAVQADFDALIALGTSQALDVIATNVEPQLTAMSAAVAALQADVAEAEDVITALITGSVPASAVAETADRIWLTPALFAAWNAKQSGDPTLTALAALTVAANKMIYATGADAFALTDITPFARQLLDDGDAATMRGTIGAADAGRQIDVGGLATGGGDLSANRTITVTKASQAQAEAGTDDATAMTPLKGAQQLAVLGLLASNANIGRRLATGTVANAGSLAIVLSSHLAAGFSKFRLHFHAYRPATDGAGMVMKVSTNGGVNYLGTNVYLCAALTAYGTTTVAAGDGTTAQAQIPLLGGLSNGGPNISSAILEFECGADFFDLIYRACPYFYSGGGVGISHGSAKGPASVNAIRFETYNGNIAAAAWSLYGAS